MKLSDYVIRFIEAQGVSHVFMVPGGGATHLNDSLDQSKSITWICNLHEQASAMAAETYAKATGNLGVALFTTGPGGTNAITGVACASAQRAEGSMYSKPDLWPFLARKGFYSGMIVTPLDES